MSTNLLKILNQREQLREYVEIFKTDKSAWIKPPVKSVFTDGKGNVTAKYFGILINNVEIGWKYFFNKEFLIDQGMSNNNWLDNELENGLRESEYFFYRTAYLKINGN